MRRECDDVEYIPKTKRRTRASDTAIRRQVEGDG